MGVYIKGSPSEGIYRLTYQETSDKGMVAVLEGEDIAFIGQIVKAPHGDLIDRSELFKWYEGQKTKYPIKKETPQYETMMMYEVFDEIDDAEAVIEAEVE